MAEAVSALHVQLDPSRSAIVLEFAKVADDAMFGRAGRDPAAYLVSQARVAALKLHPETIDRGRKHAARPLAKLMLGHAKVPVIAASFVSPGQLERSVRTLLQHAVRRRERNVYIIGLSDAMFEAMRLRAVAAGRPQSTAPTGTPDIEVAFEPVDIPPSLRQSLVGESPEMDLVRAQIVRAAAGNEPVLILGDSGTGKEVAARAVHDLNPARRLFSFVAVNCAAIATELFEAELFGYVQGAFTDARREGKEGLWVAAGKGTLFLDEVADLSLRHQAKLLRALEEGSVRPVGAVRPLPLHCRVVAATNRDLYAMVQADEFREDLYFRLRGVMIRTPRLRDHRQDIGVIAQFFWAKVAKNRPRLSEDVVEELKQCRWPGNAREMRAVLVSLTTMFPSTGPRPEHVRAVFRWHGDGPVEDEPLRPADDARLHRVECLRQVHHAEEVLRACKVLLKPLGSSKQDDSVTQGIEQGLERRLSELRVLTLNPLLFHSIATFDAVHGLVGRLATFRGLVARDPSEARSYWRRELKTDLTDTITTLAREVERLLKKI